MSAGGRPQLEIYLRDRDVSFELIEHAHSESAAGEARAAHIPAEQTAKTVVVGTRVTLTATVSDASTGNGAIAGANFTRGAANWPSSTAMAASDGSFNSPTEAVTASVDTTGWAAAAYDLCV